MGKRNLKVASGMAVLLGLVVIARLTSIRNSTRGTLTAATNPLAKLAKPPSGKSITPASVLSFPSNPKLEADIQRAQQDLVRAIEEEKVSVADLNRRANAPDALFNEDKFLAGLPPRTAQAFRELHAQLRRLQSQELAQDGKSPDFFEQPSAQAAPDDVVQHALTLERLPQSDEVKNFVASVSTHTEVRDSDISTVARLCQSDFPCIEKAAYSWIKGHLVLSQAQIQTIEQYKNGG